MSLLSMGIEVSTQTSIPKSHLWEGFAVGFKSGYRVLDLLRPGAHTSWLANGSEKNVS